MPSAPRETSPPPARPSPLALLGPRPTRRPSARPWLLAASALVMPAAAAACGGPGGFYASRPRVLDPAVAGQQTFEVLMVLLALAASLWLRRDRTRPARLRWAALASYLGLATTYTLLGFENRRGFLSSGTLGIGPLRLAGEDLLWGLVPFVALVLLFRAGRWLWGWWRQDAGGEPLPRIRGPLGFEEKEAPESGGAESPVLGVDHFDLWDHRLASWRQVAVDAACVLALMVLNPLFWLQPPF